jgi:Domain of unknown function (DUF4833)
MSANAARASARLALVVLILASQASAAGSGGERADPNRLFIIQRGVNANIVVYDAVRRADGRLDPDHPVAAYWLMKADRGQREELNPIERAEAYGFAVAGGAPGSVTITLKALKDRPIQVRATRRSVFAVTRIAGRPAVLRRVFVQTEKDHPLEVEYIELFGRALHGRAALHERMKPG